MSGPQDPLIKQGMADEGLIAGGLTGKIGENCSLDCDGKIKNINYDVEILYVIEDEIFPSIKVQVLKGQTKNKLWQTSPHKTVLPVKPPRIAETLSLENHDSSSRSSLSTQHTNECKEGKKEEISSEEKHLAQQNEKEQGELDNDSLTKVLNSDSVFDGPPPNSAILSPAVGRFNRELLKTACQIMGCKPIHGHLGAEDIFTIINQFYKNIQSQQLQLPNKSENSDYARRREGGSINIISLKNSVFLQLLKKVLLRYEYSKPAYMTDFANACKLLDRRLNLIILLGGASGTGKSTLASLIGARLGISTVLSSDSIRHIMRNFLLKEENGILFASTYETAKFVENPNGKSEKKLLLKGFKNQCEYVHPHLKTVIDALLARKESVVIEGVHLTVGFMKKIMKEYNNCICFTVFIKNDEKHKERFFVRSKRMTIDPRFNKYVQHFKSIRIIHKSSVKNSEKALIPKIDNTNVDKSLGIIHSTIVRSLRKIVNNEPLYDKTRKQATGLYQEFNAVNKNRLSSSEAQKIIRSKVNKGEIFRRFLEDRDENQRNTFDEFERFAPQEGLTEEEKSKDKGYEGESDSGNNNEDNEEEFEEEANPSLNEYNIKLGDSNSHIDGNTLENYTNDVSPQMKKMSKISSESKLHNANTAQHHVHGHVHGEEEENMKMLNKKKHSSRDDINPELPHVHEESKILMPVKKIKSQENISSAQSPDRTRRKEKRKKLVTFGKVFFTKSKAKLPHDSEKDSEQDEDHQSLYSGSGICSLASVSADVITHVKTDDNASQGLTNVSSEEEDDDPDSLEVEQTSPASEEERPSNSGSEPSSDSDTDKKVREQLRKSSLHSITKKKKETSPVQNRELEKNFGFEANALPDLEFEDVEAETKVETNFLKNKEEEIKLEIRDTNSE